MFGLFPVKLYRSINHAQVNTVAYVVSSNKSIISLYDTAGNLLDVYSVEAGTKIVSISTPLAADDMLITVLTDSDNLYVLRLFINDVYAGVS